MALMKADDYTDREKITYRGALAYKYKLMEKGEDYITNFMRENSSDLNGSKDYKKEVKNES